MSDLVGNPEDGFSRVGAHLINVRHLSPILIIFVSVLLSISIEMCLN